MTATSNTSPVNSPPASGNVIFQKIETLSTSGLESLLKNMLLKVSEKKVLQYSSADYRRLINRLEPKKPAIKSGFTFQLKKNFNDFNTHDKRLAEENQTSQLQDLGLLDASECAESDALETMVTSYDECYGGFYQTMAGGFGQCFKRSIGQPKDNPLHARRLFEAFEYAIDSLGFDATDRIALHQLFADTVIDSLEPLYKRVEQCFIEHQLLPEARIMPDKPKAQEPSTTTKSSGSVPMSQIPVLMAVFQDFRAKSSFSNGRYANLFPELKQALQKRGINDFDSVIGQLSSIFEIMLGDQDLPDKIKELVARLQIFVFMSEIQQSGFATRSNHPARRLIDSIIRTEVDIAEGSDGKKSGYDFLKHRIDQLGETPFVDADGYAELLKAYTEQIGTKGKPVVISRPAAVTKPAATPAPVNKTNSKPEPEKARLEPIKPVSRPAAAPPAQSKLVSRPETTMEVRAISTSIQNIYPVVQSIVSDMTLPLRVQGRSLILFDEVWSPLLLEVAIAKGFKSPAWQKVLTIAKAQVWMLIPKSSEVELKKLMTSLAHIEKSLTQSMQSLKLPIDQQASLLEFLEHEQADVIARSKANVEQLKQPTAASAKGAPATKATVGTTNKPKSEKVNFANTVDEFSTLMQTGRFKKSNDMLEALGSEKGSRKKSKPPCADNIHKSDWIEIKKSGKTVLAKLTWKDADNKQFIFVDREGNRVCDISKDDLNKELAAGTISLISSTSNVSQQAASNVIQTFK